MDISYLVDALTVAVSLGGSYLLGRYGRKVNKSKDFIHTSDDGKHIHEFGYMTPDGKWRCVIMTENGACNVAKDFE